MKSLLSNVLLILSIVFSASGFAMPINNVDNSLKASQNLVIDGDFECFTLGEKVDHTLPFFPNFQFKMCTLNNANNSPAILHHNDGDPFVELKYDGTSAGDNSNLWMFFNSFAQGKGTYTIQYDVYAEGLSTSDWIGWQLLGVDGSLNLEGYNVRNKAEYDALPNSTSKTGWKHVSFTVEQTYAQGKNNDTLVINFYNKKNANMFCYLDNFSVKKGDMELFLDNGTYAGDFSYCYLDEVPLTVGAQYGYGTLNNSSPPKIFEENGNKVCKFSYSPGRDNLALMYKFVSFDGPGLYTFELDIKFLPTTNAYDFGMRLAGPKADGNTEVLSLAYGHDDLENLEDSTVLSGYKHLSVDVFLDSYQSTNVDSFHIYYGTMGRDNDYIIVDNICITLKKSSEVKTASHISENYVDLIGDGNFERFPTDLSFTNDNAEILKNWSTIYLDSPGKVIDDNGNKVLMLQYNGLPSFHYVSVFNTIYNPRFRVNNSYTLSFDYKQDFETPTSIDRRWHVSFVGTLGRETYKCYLNSLEALGYTNAPYNITNGVNEDLYSFTVTRNENGWCHFEMSFDTNYSFMEDVDTLRFVFDSEMNENNIVYLDNIKLLAYGQDEEEFTPYYPSYNNANSPVIPALIIGGSILLVAGITVAIIVIIRKRKVAK